MSKRWQLTLTVVSLISGILLMSLILANQAARSEAAESSNEDLIEIINRVEEETVALEELIDEKRDRIDQIREHKVEDGELTVLQSELEWLRRRVGLTQVTGPGITVILDDNEALASAAKATNPLSFDPNSYIIHDKDLLYLVNDLKIGGAEAISINNQRIITSSDIRCVGTVILVNSTRLAPPYEIRAIGNPEKLMKQVSNGQTYPWLKSRDFPVEIIEEEVIQIPTYKGSFATGHLQVTKGESETND
ncbi:MAG: DUF881 domain-containing protein [Clostridia bacterium]|jgi:uncharacterized protein YlxW (UPF0749 family)|nr:DUF881 domain-containing protein [Clostridia bacterium]